MNRERVLRLLEDVSAGRATPESALDRLAWLPLEPVAPVNGTTPGARIDHHRHLRLGWPEVVYGPGKTADQLVAICEGLARRGDGFLVTRADAAARRALSEAFPSSVVHDIARIVHLPGREARPPGTGFGPILVMSAGTADLPVAEEAAVTARALGHDVDRLYDVGVAGIHRLMEERDRLARAAAVIVVAGMDGALPSVVGGLVGAPVIAVPTSVGYGAAFGGLAPLLTMLNSCAAGVVVVNVDNGFGAACAASRMTRRGSAAHAVQEPVS